LNFVSAAINEISNGNTKQHKETMTLTWCHWLDETSDLT